MEFTLIWYGEEVKIPIEEGQTILEALKKADHKYDIEGWCQSENMCHNCCLALTAGSIQSDEGVDQGEIVSCQSFIINEGTVLEYPYAGYNAYQLKQHEERVQLLAALKLNASRSLEKQGEKELVLYHPDYWFFDSDWAKNLLLFADGICLLIPSENQLNVVKKQEYFLRGCSDEGVIHILNAEEVITDIMTIKLRDTLETAISQGMFNDITQGATSLISLQRLGFESHYDSANWMYNALKKMNLVQKPKNNMMEIDAKVYGFIISFLAHLISASKTNNGISMYPVTDRDSAIQDLRYLASFGNYNLSQPEVMMFDFQTVGVDLSGMPVDEIISYKKENSVLYQNYIKTARRFIREVYNTPEELRKEALNDREQEIAELAIELRRASRRAWSKPANFSLTVAGAAISLATSNPLPAAVLATAAAVSNLFDKPAPKEAGLYSYIFNLPRKRDKL